jgi:DnaJ domain
MDLNVSPDEIRLFSDRIRRSLRERPLEGDAGHLRAEIAALVSRVGWASCYELLAIDPSSNVGEIHDAFESLARRVHPDHAARFGLGGREGVLDLLFERAVWSYLTLSHPDRRRAYDRDLPPEAWRVGRNETRPDERKAIARQLYERANALYANKEFHFAVELLRQAIRADERGEYYALLGRAQAENPRWLRQAAESLRLAIEKGHRDAETSAAQKSVRERIERGEGERESGEEASSS